MTYKEMLTHITTFIFDVDGVITNGQVLLYKDEWVRSINSRDSYAMQYATKMGYSIFVITGGSSTIVRDRLIGAGAKEVILNASHKEEDYESLKSKFNFTDQEVLYMGDDIPDYFVMKKVGVAACPSDAAVEIKEISNYHSAFKGGRHCVRDVIEQTLRVQGKWFGEDAHLW